MVKKYCYIALSIIIIIGIYLTIFELILCHFHYPFYDEALENHVAYAETWNYLLKQKYITFIDLDLFNLYEKRHLLDVKKILKESHVLWMMFGSLAFLLLVIFFKRVVKYIARFGLISTLFLTLLAFDFQNSFRLFHTMIFTNQSWIFLKNSLLIELFPTLYFQEFFAMFLLISASIFSLLKVIYVKKLF